MNQLPDSCAKVDALLLDYAYGELDAGSRAKVDAHLASCERCRGALEEISGTRRLMQVLEPEPPPTDGLESLLDFAQRSVQSRQSPPKRAWRWLVPAFSAGGLALALLLVVAGHEGLGPALTALPAPQPAPPPVEQKAAAAAPVAGPGANAFAASEALKKVETGEIDGYKALAQPVEATAGAAKRDDAPAAPEELASGTVSGSAAARSRAVAKEESKAAPKPRAKSAMPDALGALGGSAAKGGGGAREQATAGLAERREAGPASFDALAEEEAAPEAPRPAPAASAPSLQERPAVEAASRQARQDMDGAAASDEAPPDSERLVHQEKRKAALEKQALSVGDDSDEQGSAMARARAASARGDHLAAARILMAAVDASPDDARRPGLLMMLARELELAGDLEGALATYARVMAEYPAQASATAAAEARARLQQTAPAERPAAGRGAGWPGGAAASPQRAAPAAKEAAPVDSE